jgi:hypothetical protein
MNLKQLTNHQVAALAAAHIKRFSWLIEQANEGSPNIRVDECEYYLTVWTGVAQKVRAGTYSPENLSVHERDELRDAIASGDYDDDILAVPHGTN